MSKVDVYVAEYLTIDEVTHEESERLASNECMIGNPLTLRFDPEKKAFRVYTQQGNPIGLVHPKNRLALKEALENGWPCKCWLSLVYYNDNDGEKLFHGEVVYQFYNLKPTQTAERAALDAFADHVSALLAEGKRPRVSLTGTQYEEVISGGGTYEPQGTEPLPISGKAKSGTVVFKRKRSVSDRLALSAMENKPGCRIATTVFFLLVALLVLFLLWRFVFSRFFG